ncbi:MAG: hypothetical protein ACI82G_000171 [Bradymonadia bacterium]|jgi:hypothetical protein
MGLMARSRRSNRTISPRRVLYTAAAVVALVSGSFVAGFVLGQQVPMPVSSYFETPESFELPSMAIEAPSLDPDDAPDVFRDAEEGFPAENIAEPTTGVAVRTAPEISEPASAEAGQRVLAREPAATQRRIIYASGE